MIAILILYLEMIEHDNIETVLLNFKHIDFH